MIRGLFYNLKSKKARFIRCAGLFGYLPYEIPTFQPSRPSPNLTSHRHFLVLQALAPQGYFFAKLLVN